MVALPPLDASADPAWRSLIVSKSLVPATAVALAGVLVLTAAVLPLPLRAAAAPAQDAPRLPDSPDLPERVAAVPDSLHRVWTATLGGDGPHALMSFLFEVTFMKIDVAVVEVRLTDHDAALVAAVVAEGERDDDRRDRVAAILHAADPLAYGMTFKRDSDLGKFFKGMLGNMERAVEAGEITPQEYDRVDREYRALMAPYGERGARKGDRLLYRLDGDRLHLIYVGVDGDVMLDEHLDEVWARAVRASFTGRESKMREKLGELAWR